MSVVDTVIGWTRQLASRTAHAIVHPVETAGEVVERAGDVAISAAAVVASATKEAEKEPVDWATAVQQGPEPVTPTPQPVEEALAAETRLTDEPVFTEPKPSDVDDWRDELDEPDLGDVVPEPPRADDDTPLLDPSIAKAVRHESETLRRAAERNPEEAQDVR